MDKLFGDLKNFFKAPSCNIDNIVFRFHYKFTLAILIAFSIAVTGSQFVGNPIECISKDDIPDNLLKTFCWVSTTFSIKSAWKKEVGKEVPYPGIYKHVPGEDRVYHAYYQWVCFVLFLQGLFFYLPRYLWKNIENHKILNLRMNLYSPVVEPKTRDAQTKLLAEYLNESLGHHNFYSYMFAVCELLNFVNVMVQIWIMDTFLGGEFTTYGTDVLKFTEWDYALRYDPMIKVFPRMSKCTFYRYGSSGDVQKHDAMCLISINILNEKIYIFLWFWFLMMAIISGIILIYRVATIRLPFVRLYVLRYKCPIPKKSKKSKDIENGDSDSVNKALLEGNADKDKDEKGQKGGKDDSDEKGVTGKNGKNEDIPKSDLEIVLEKCSYSDWLLLSLLCKNIRSGNFKEMLQKFANILRKKTH